MAFWPACTAMLVHREPVFALTQPKASPEKKIGTTVPASKWKAANTRAVETTAGPDPIRFSRPLSTYPRKRTSSLKGVTSARAWKVRKNTQSWEKGFCPDFGRLQ